MSGPSPAALEAAAVECLRRGDEAGAERHWRQLVALQPAHPLAWTQLGQAAFRRNDFAGSQACFEQAAVAAPQLPRSWINVALAAQRTGNEVLESSALERALQIDAYDLTALFLRGRFNERQGRTAHAARSFGAMLAVASQQPAVPPELEPALAHAQEFQQRYQASLADTLDAALAAELAALPAAQTDRFRHSLDILVGRRRRFDSQPMLYYYPRLPAVEFFDRADFPWLDPIEAATDAIRAEFEAVRASGPDGFSPYIQYGADQPLAQWRELNHNPAWSAFHLVKDGVPVAGNAERCPRTMALWRQTPWPDQPGRTPVALFSALQPHTRIPPHVGASNCRLLVHLPLIVPPKCRYRVGSQWREWRPGHCFIFDDTIEHEAWNDSDELRVVLIFDTWHPMLTPDERQLITAMNRALNTFSQDSAGGYGS